MSWAPIGKVLGEGKKTISIFIILMIIDIYYKIITYFPRREGDKCPVLSPLPPPHNEYPWCHAHYNNYSLFKLKSYFLRGP